MGRHSLPRSRRLGPGILLGLATLSVGSPVGLLLLSQPLADLGPEQDPVQTEQGSLNIALGPPELVLADAVERAHALNTASTTTGHARAVTRPQARSQVRQHISTPVSVPTPTVTTRPNRPSVAERQIRRATTPKPIPSRTIQSTTTQPKPKPKPSILPTTTTQKAPPATIPKVQTPSHQLLVQIAQKYVRRGIPYLMGGNSPTAGMDCSHFVWMILKEAGHNVPYRNSGALASWITRTSSPQPGDLVLFRGHVGLFVGNGMMIDQGSSDGAHLSTIKYYNNFIGYGRMSL